MEMGLTKKEVERTMARIDLRKELQRKPPNIGKPERVIKVPRPPVPQTGPPKPTPGP